MKLQNIGMILLMNINDKLARILQHYDKADRSTNKRDC